jgi:hypothetical protein
MDGFERRLVVFMDVLQLGNGVAQIIFVNIIHREWRREYASRKEFGLFRADFQSEKFQ